MTQSQPLGLTLGFFKHFVDLHGGRDAFQGLSTADVCTDHVKPYTSSSQLSLVDHVHENHPQGDQYVKPATWFVSHAWSYLFLDVVDALCDFFEDEGLNSDNVAVWFCMFNNNQHQIADQIKEFSFWVDSFQTALRAIGNVVMVLSPWNNPTTLTRTWCVFEIYVAIVTTARFEIAMGKTQKQTFLDNILHDNAFHKMLSSIETEASTTTIPSDRDNIANAIADANVTFEELDRLLFDLLDATMMRTVDAQIDAAVDLADKARWLIEKMVLLKDKTKLDDALDCGRLALEIYRVELHDVEPDTWKAMARCAFLISRLQERQVWEPMFQEALARQLEMYGNEHTNTLCILQIMGQAYLANYDVDAALPLLTECLNMGNRVVRWDTSRLRAIVMLDIGTAYFFKNEIQIAIGWFQRSLARLSDASDPTTIKARIHLGLSYFKIGKYDDAERLLHDAYVTTRRTYGPFDYETRTAHRQLAVVYLYQGKYSQAEHIVRSMLENHASMILDAELFAYAHDLGRILLFQGEQLDEAQVYLVEAFQLAKERFGGTHGHTLVVLTTLVCAMYDPIVTLTDVSNWEAKLNEAEWNHDTWTLLPCHGCFRSIQGMYFSCSLCPKYSIRLCGPCLAQNVSICGHESPAFRLHPLKPPVRFLQEKRLELLALGNQWHAYKEHYQVYEAYCATFEVPQAERMERRQQNSWCARVLWLALFWVLDPLRKMPVFYNVLAISDLLRLILEFQDGYPRDMVAFASMAARSGKTNPSYQDMACVLTLWLTQYDLTTRVPVALDLFPSLKMAVMESATMEGCVCGCA
ncbi:Aste57867_22697 [Aphanomyces stellatus]|uniref:Aste57867_22697 protein n=1 Tax=Aphanomyces stellatus TaxID=120398 RepID=A0A485LKW9_9STRA|nr:hypothetical protein As57867_022627 [Aphanomyces stellatus]VFT99351.1 Aste57867_22697 [Aphanomyces stellatus]